MSSNHAHSKKSTANAHFNVACVAQNKTLEILQMANAVSGSDIVSSSILFFQSIQILKNSFFGSNNSMYLFSSCFCYHAISLFLESFVNIFSSNSCSSCFWV